MKLLPGWELISQTDTEIVQRQRFGETGEVIMYGPTDGTPEEMERRKAALTEALMPLIKAYYRNPGRAVPEEQSG